MPKKQKIQSADSAESNGQEAPARKAIEIKGASIDGTYGSYSYHHQIADGITNKHTVKSGLPIHDDLKEAFNGLNTHLAIICEEINSKHKTLFAVENDKANREKIELFAVNGFKIEGGEDNRQITLFGTKVLSTGDELKLETPKKNLDSDYPFAHELSEALDECISEVEEYMNGKRAPEPQAELEFPVEQEKYSEEGV